MDGRFPTFRRLIGGPSPLAKLWPWRTTKAQQQSLLRLIVAATEEGIPLSRLIEVWAADESGAQSSRLRRLAKLLRDGMPLPEAIEEVRGALGDEDVLAIRFGYQSGTLAAAIRARLARPEPALGYGSVRVRHFYVYLCLVTLIAFVIVTFSQIKIVPMLNAIVQEFDIPRPGSLKWSINLASIVADYWYLFALAFIALWLLIFSRPGRQVRLRISSRLFRPLRELRFADVLQKLSVATRAGRPIAGALSTLARYHFDPSLRHQLLFIRNELEHGADIWHSMGRLGLLSPPEVRVLETSERVGNQSWVLQQLALVKKRRTMRRLAHWSELVLPLCIILAGAFVLLQALSMFQTLLNIVYSLL